MHDVAVPTDAIALGRPRQILLLQEVGKGSIRRSGHGDSGLDSPRQGLIDNIGGSSRERVEVGIIPGVVASLTHTFHHLSSRRYLTSFLTERQAFGVLLQGGRKLLEPGSDVGPTLRSCGVHLVEGIAQVLQRRRNAVQLSQVLARVMEDEITFQLGSHHVYREARPLIGDGRQLGDPTQLVSPEIGECVESRR